jgi:membrane protein DedA with SNARE-associated domain
MPLAGFVAARGQLTLIGVVLAGTIGSLTGALFWYGVGRWIGFKRLKTFSKRHGRWLTLSGNGVLILALGVYGYRVLTFGKTARAVP